MRTAGHMARRSRSPSGIVVIGQVPEAVFRRLVPAAE
jgi:hypothetical protein